MDENKKGTETNASAIPPEGTVTAPTVQDDAEARIAALEAEKATILEREANYKMAYLKEKNKKEVIDPDESDEDRIRRIAREELASKEVGRIDMEKENLLKRLAKENKELKLAQLNKTSTPPAAIGGHSEVSIPVMSTIVTPEQIAHFKSIGKDDRWIESYRKNLQKNSR